MSITNPIWGTAAVLEKSRNRYMSATVRPISTKFGTIRKIDPLEPSVKKLKF